MFLAYLQILSTYLQLFTTLQRHKLYEQLNLIEIVDQNIKKINDLLLVFWF